MNAVSMHQICKFYPGVKAVDTVDFEVKSGEIHGLIGENGAGKTTLMEILYGLQHPDSGTIEINGEPVKLSSPQNAMNLRIGMVHQHFQLVPSLSVLRNIVLGNPMHDHVLINQNRARKKIKQIMDCYGLSVDLDAKAYQLSVGEKQRVEIIKALFRDVNILILDEPTAVLTPQETEELIAVLQKLRDAGCSIIFITHKLKEIIAVASKITVMCKGRITGNVDAANTDENELSTMMVGRVVSNYLPRKAFSPGKEILRVENASCLSERGLLAINHLSLSVRQGEILGIAGVEGNGQTELVELITGMIRIREGNIFIQGESVLHDNVRGRRERGLSHIPEDRIKTGAARDCTVSDNLISNRYCRRPLSKHGVLCAQAIREYSERMIQDYGIKVPNGEYALSTLSGGNMQKVILAREMEANPKILVAAQPTRGVDIGAIEYIHTQLLKLRDQGNAILLISAELSEIFALSDRILVLFEGEIVFECCPAEVTEAQLGLYMTGARRSMREKE